MKVFGQIVGSSITFFFLSMKAHFLHWVFAAVTNAWPAQPAKTSDMNEHDKCVNSHARPNQKRQAKARPQPKRRREQNSDPKPKPTKHRQSKTELGGVSKHKPSGPQRQHNSQAQNRPRKDTIYPTVMTARGQLRTSWGRYARLCTPNRGGDDQP